MANTGGEQGIIIDIRKSGTCYLRRRALCYYWESDIGDWGEGGCVGTPHPFL